MNPSIFQAFPHVKAPRRLDLDADVANEGLDWESLSLLMTGILSEGGEPQL